MIWTWVLGAALAAPSLGRDDIQVLGDRDAPDVVLQISDWRCPHCAVAFPIVLDAVRDAPHAQLRFWSFPLTLPCNPDARHVDEARCELGRAALCASDAGVFLGFAERVFGGAGWRGAVFDTPRFRRCVERRRTERRLARQIDAARALEIRGTPTIWVRRGGAWQEVAADEVAPVLAGAAR